MLAISRQTWRFSTARGGFNSVHSVRQMSGVIARLKVELHETLGGRLNNTTWKTNSSEISLAREIITETYVNGVDNNNDYKNDHNNDPVEINGGTLIQEQLINNNRRKKKMKNHKNEIKEEDKEMIIKDVNNKHALKPKSQNKALTKEKILAQHQESILKQEGIKVLEILNKKVSIIDEILIKKIDDNEIKEVASLDDVITVLCKIQTLKERERDDMLSKLTISISKLLSNQKVNGKEFVRHSSFPPFMKSLCDSQNDFLLCQGVVLCSRLHIKACPLYTKVMDRQITLFQENNKKKIDLRNIINTISSLANINKASAEYMNATVNYLLDQELTSAQCQVLSKAMLKMKDKCNFEINQLYQLSELVLKNNENESLTTKQISNIVYNITEMLPEEERDKKFDYFFEQIASLSISKLSKFKHFELANVLCSYASNGACIAKVANSIPLFEKSATHVSSKINDFDYSSLATISWSFAAARIRSQQMFSKISNKVIKEKDHNNLLKLAAEDFSNLLWGFGRNGGINQEFYNTVATVIVTKINSNIINNNNNINARFSHQELAMTCWGFAKAKANNPTLFNLIAEEFTKMINEDAKQPKKNNTNILSTESVINIVWAFSKTNSFSKDFYSLVARYLTVNSSSLLANQISSCAFAMYAVSNFKVDNDVKKVQKNLFEALSSSSVAIYPSFSNSHLTPLLSAFVMQPCKEVDGVSIFKLIGDSFINNRQDFQNWEITAVPRRFLVAQQKGKIDYPYYSLICHTASKLAIDRFASLRSKQIFSIFIAFSQISVEPLPFFAHFENNLSRVINKLTPDDVTNVISELGEAQIKTKSIYRALSQRDPTYPSDYDNDKRSFVLRLIWFSL